MKSLSLIFASLILTGTFAEASSSLSCKFDADPQSSIGIAVDEATSQKETVLIGINWNKPGQGDTKSAMLNTGDLAKQISSGAVVIAFGDDADPAAVEIFDSVLVAVKRVGKTNQFKGYLSRYDDGVAALTITCKAK